ncbi:MAG: hypothetical protein IIA63_04690 [Nitrospinae bacterium]|nr:hypothetical protein [Nitrospinota bacterium]MCH7650443.1 hypothetical protein [Nitrospinota bacterium]MCH8933723.1 hypothetical protein [Nitrospinota bacterium]
MSPNLVLMTGPDLRHRYFINRLNREFPITCVFIETLSYPEIEPSSPKDQAAWDWFFTRRGEYETQTFADSETWPLKNKPRVIRVPEGGINSADTLISIQAQHPDLIILFGTSLIGPSVLERFPDRTLNLHVGISGQYRGSSCNFWPIHDERLDCLGATVMRINAGIDTGEILAQETIALEEQDTEQTLMGKSLILGVDLTIQIVHQWMKGNRTPLPLEANGKLFLKNDFKPEAVSRVKEMVEGGHLTFLIRKHLKPNEKLI